MSDGAADHARGAAGASPGAATAEAGFAGIAAGTAILTLDGALPVDFIEPGDRIVTRSGMRVVREVAVRRWSGPAMRIAAGALGEGRPEQDLILPAATPVLLRDGWARLPDGARQAVVPLGRLADGARIAPVTALSLRLYDLRFDRAETVYAEGLEIACPSVAAADEARLAAE